MSLVCGAFDEPQCTGCACRAVCKNTDAYYAARRDILNAIGTETGFKVSLYCPHFVKGQNRTRGELQ